MVSKTAKIFPQGVGSGSFGDAPNLAPLVERENCIAVRSSERAEIGQRTIPPKDGVQGCVARQGCIANHPAFVV